MPIVYPQLGGADGVKQTLGMMKNLINQSLTNVYVRSQAAQAIGGCDRGNRVCQCHSLLAWVKRKMRYIPDAKGVEMLHNPGMIAQAIHEGRYVYGDCDDMSMYLATPMKSIGLSPSLRAVGYNGNQYQHVYVRCEGLPCDATRDAWTERPRLPVEETSVMDVIV